MNYIAICDGEGKGIYAVRTSAELDLLIKRYPSSPYRIFSEKEQPKALEWAKSHGITSFQAAPEPAKHPFIRMLDRLKNLGYSAAELFLTSDKGISRISIWIDDFLYYNSNKYVYSVNFNGSANISDAGELQPFDHFKSEFEEARNKFLERHTLCDKYEFKPVLTSAIEQCGPEAFQKISAAKIEIIGDYALIDNCCKDILYATDTYAEQAIRTNDETHNLVINLPQLIKIQPFHCPYRITDPAYAEVITEYLTKD